MEMKKAAVWVSILSCLLFGMTLAAAGPARAQASPDPKARALFKP